MAKLMTSLSSSSRTARSPTFLCISKAASRVRHLKSRNTGRHRSAGMLVSSPGAWHSNRSGIERDQFRPGDPQYSSHGRDQSRVEPQPGPGRPAVGEKVPQAGNHDSSEVQHPSLDACLHRRCRQSLLRGNRRRRVRSRFATCRPATTSSKRGKKSWELRSRRSPFSRKGKPQQALPLKENDP